MLKLVASADVFSENFKPGTMDKLGLDYAALATLNPRLVYVSHKGFLPGPYEHRTALDEVVQMMGGLAYMTGPEGRPLRAGTQRQRHHGRHVRRDRRAGRAAPSARRPAAARRCRARCSRTTCSSSRST